MMKMFNYNYCVSVEWLAPCMFKATVKRTTNTLRILPPTFKPVSQQIRLLQFAFILDSDWKKLRGSRAIRGSYVTCCKTSLPWAGKTRASCTDFLTKSRTTFYFGNNFPQPATNWFVAREVWFVGDEMGNTAFQLVLYQCCKTSCTFFSPVCGILKLENCKTSCTFFSPVCGILKLENLGDLLYLLKDTGEKNWWFISEESKATLHLSIREDKTYKVQRTVSTNQETFYHSII